jgi:hypothetical protein
VNGIVPLHFYIERNARNLQDLLKYLVQNDVSHVWFEITGNSDTVTSQNISDSFNLQVISVIKDKKLLQEILKTDIRGIAVGPEMGIELLRYADTLKNRNITVCLCAGGPDSTITKENEFITSLNEISRSADELKKAGVKNLYFNIHHPNPVIHFNTNKLIKDTYGLKHIISLTPCEKREDSVILNSLSLGSLFYEKIGDAVLLRLPSDKKYTSQNVKGAVELSKKILGSCRLFPRGYTIISCPTCGRCRLDLLKMTEEIDCKLRTLEKNYNQEGKKLEDVGGIAVAVMGCNVNGPGEARSADIGIAGRNNKTGIIFKNGKPFKTLPENKLVDELLIHTKNIIDQKFKAAG